MPSSSSQSASQSDSQRDSAPAKVTLTPVEETLLVILYFRVQDAASPEPILGDIYAKQIINKVDIDFNRPLFPSDPRWTKLWCSRAKTLDTWCRDFLDKNPVCTVLHLGCGMDSRVMRVNPGPGVRWIDVDRPAVIDLRERLIPTPSGDYRMMAANVMEDRWLTEIPNDRPTIVVMEGLVMYLTQDKGQELLTRLVDHFSPGGNGILAFDVVGSIASKLLEWGWVPPLRGSSVRWTWWVDDPPTLAALHPKLEFIEEAKYPDEVPPWFGEIKTKFIQYLPSFRNIGRVTRYKF